MLLLVGLGNPGPSYAGHRHNLGFMAVERIAARHRFAAGRRQFQGITAEGTLGTEKVLALKPQTYMNDSGRSVGEAVRFFKLEPAQVVVIYDELDLAPGRLRMKQGGGAAGHNGIRSIHAAIGPDYRRVRVGIGHPGHKDAVMPYVLHDFSKADQLWLDPLLDAIADAAPSLAANDDVGFANRVALLTQPQRAHADPAARPA